eukprot:TRINITY_DN3540_c0_g1_i18.p1 TRINITY_DN3540_c0_g1~~TRINITY_DN3540_c0_g1_i18.p1  ORF type:complete len:113 (+),score=21.31 TRINITY_DN3540_c0_g1_i18:110-448(+)
MYFNSEPPHSHQWNCPSWCGLKDFTNVADWNQVELCKGLLSDNLISEKEFGFKQLHFGKYKNQFYKDLTSKDEPYCVWLLSQSWLEDFDKGIILVHLLNHKSRSYPILGPSH